ncbi:MAG: gliding motility-associated C-terminal domain-containing protein [Flavobacteriales bacterium]|nr:gliding motility-associated C-terminal domain-containing protein [Flavobacteriales bacterium]
MRTTALTALTIAALHLSLPALGAARDADVRTLHWVGGAGAWSDAAHWSLSPSGTGGAGVPGHSDDVVIAPLGEVTIGVEGVARCRDLRVDGAAGFVRLLGGARDELRIAGSWRIIGSVDWSFVGSVRLAGDRQGLVVDTRGIPLSSQVIFDGRGSWTLLTDLHLTQGDITLREGVVHAGGGLLQARTVCSEGRAPKRLMAGSSVIQLARAPESDVLARVVEAQQAVLVIDGTPMPSPQGLASEGEARDVSVCATGAGQTPFIATTSALTNYNGFNIRCRGECNATITVDVTGGIGPFTYSWLFGGPGTQTWVGACGGPQIVVVTDEGQGVSCGVTLNVTEPSPLGVIFFGAGTPPTCADVCNGSRTALPIGGVSPHTFNWNNGAGSGASFNQLCAGLNTLQITDANNCTFDTTFFFNLLPIMPNLTFTDVTCSGGCDGTASVNPSGGTPPFTILWAPPPGAGQGTNDATQLCAGPYSVTITDFNGCDTTVAFTITEPPPIVPNPSQTDATCFGQCDGSASVNPRGSPGPFSYVWTPDVTGQGTESATALCAGNYSVLITDQVTGCTATADFVIISQPAIDVQGIVTPASCSDACDGAISITIDGPPPPYSITWSPDPGPGQGTTSVSDLCPGDWQVTVATPNGCDTTIIFNIPAPAPIDAEVITTDASCAGVCDGIATCPGVSGGTAPYAFLWSPSPGGGQGTQTATDLCAGNYTLLITDANGCDTLINFTINEPPPLVVTPSQTNLTCGGLCDGTASVVVMGGTPNYTYAWTPNVTGQGTPDATGLCAGPYSVLITDANGCTFTQAFTILDAVPLEVSLQVLPATCPDACDGSAGVIVTGGQEPYTYDWQPPPTGQGTPNVTGLCAQAYTLLITDAAGCDTLIAFTVPSPPPVTVVSTIDEPDCAGDCNGSISLQVSGGSGGFIYLWTPNVVGQGTPNATGLCAGSYQVTITSGACDTTLTFLLDAPPPIDASGAITPPTCAGECDGSIVLTVSGGSPGYTYAWSPNVTGQGTPNATALCAGVYSVLITDQAGCDTTLTFQLDDPPAITVDLTTTPASCGGLCDGTATAVVSGGTEPYIYDWQTPPGGGQGTPNATAYCPGAYTLTVTDANGCQVVTPFTISTPSGIDAQGVVTPASCGNTCDGAIDVTVGGGLPAYVFTWSPEPGGGQGTPNAFNLCPGNWTLQITDAALCDTVLLFVVDAPDAIIPNPSQTDETCNGPCDGTATVNPTGGQQPFTYLWSPGGQTTPSISGLCQGVYSVTISDASGCDTTVVFDILPEVPLEANLITTDATCPDVCDGTATVTPTGGTAPYTIVWSPAPPGGQQGNASITGLCIGALQVTVTDVNGCTSTANAFINAPPPFSSGLVVTPETCDGPCNGTATVTPTGGTGAIDVFWAPPPGTGQGTNSVTGLCAGIAYTVTFTDGNGCIAVFPFTVDPFDPILPNSSSTPVSCAGVCDGTATVGPTGGTAPYTYLWSPGGQDTPQVTGLCEGAYTVTITDTSGCSIDAQILITGPPPIDAQATVAGISCNGQCDGSITLATIGGTGPYTYLWNPIPPNGQGQDEATSLCAGIWNVIITDANGCTLPLSFDLTQPDPLSLILDVTPSECQVCIGAASATVSGGTGPFLVEWYAAGGSLIGTGTDITDLCAGVYTAVVTDDNGCTLQQAVTIIDSNGEVITTTDGSTSCPNTCDGSVSVSFICSDAPCTIAWFDAQGNDLQQSGNTLSGLCPGDYYALVTNASGCVSIDTATVVAAPPTNLLISSTPVSCAGLCNGTATVGVSGGIPPYTWQWSPEPDTGQGTPLATGLCAGVYTVLISDGGGCDTTVQVLITEPLPLVVDAVMTDITCAGECDGSIALTITGGTAPYNVLWNPVPSNGQGVLNAMSLCAGDYTVVVTDANGCAFTFTYTITEPAPLQASVSTVQSTCPDCDGQASVIVSGGTLPLTITWSLGGSVVGTGESITDLCGGLYSVSIVDANGCSIALTAQVADSNADPLTPTSGQTTCANDCDGTVSVSFVCSAPPCQLTWFDAQGNVIALNAGSVSNLCVGIYTAQLTNGNGCVSFADAQVVPSQTIIPNLSSTPASCFGACDGTATVGPDGGVEPYEYLWSPGGQMTPQVTGLCAGVYTVLITDASLCDTTVQVLIIEPQPLSINGTVQDALCAGDCNGGVSVIVTGGTAPYTYFWSPSPPSGQGTPSITDLCAGTYLVTVTDANGCSQAVSFDVNQPQPLQASLTTTPSECSVCIGTATLAITGGTAPYFVVWSDGVGIIGTGESITDLCAGFYTATITDANLCVITQLVAISDSDGEVTTMTDGLTTCPGDCDGQVSVDFTCADPLCAVAWFDASGNDLNEPGNTLSNLCAGMYFVQVTNASGCITIDTAFVAEPDPIVPNLSTTAASCFGDCDGTATVGPTGGQPGYDIVWSPGGETTPEITGLCAGQYSVTITDQAGCSITQDVLILEPQPLSITGTISPITCNGACDGAITAVVSGGTQPYSYAWSPAPPGDPTQPTIIGLCAGDWIVTVTDGNGCTASQTFTLTDPPLLEAQVATTDNLCYGDCQGTAQASISGGVGPYVIVWRDGSGSVIAQDVTDVSGLCAGDYMLEVTDDNGCMLSVPFTITQGAAIEANLLWTNETCFGPCDGTASITPSGGTGPFTIEWRDPSGNVIALDVTDVGGLCAGTNSVTLIDALGCDTTYSFTLLPYTVITDNAIVTDVQCNGACDGSIVLSASGGIGAFTYTWDPVPPNGQGNASATGLCPNTYSVTIADGVGCSASFSYTITEPTALAIAVDQVTDASCADASDGAIAVTVSGGTTPYGFNWSGPGGFQSVSEDINDLAPGSYILTVTDDNGCVITQAVTVNALSTVVANAGVDITECFGVSITLDGSQSTGAVTYQWFDDQGNVVGTDAVITINGLGNGTHTFTLVVADGPCTSSDTVMVTVLDLPIADAGPDQFIFLSETAQLGGAPTGPQGSTFFWSPDSLLNSGTIANPIADPPSTTWFTVLVTAPNGCTSLDSVLVTVVPEIIIPTGFTPNGDGWNDTWVIDYIELFPECEVELYNRWGELLFRSVGYRQPWEGKYNGGFVPVGTYYYVIELNDPRFPDAFTGPLTVIR